MKKKGILIVALLLIIVFCCAMLVGCKDGKDTTMNEENNSSTKVVVPDNPIAFIAAFWESDHVAKIMTVWSDLVEDPDSNRTEVWTWGMDGTKLISSKDYSADEGQGQVHDFWGNIYEKKDNTICCYEFPDQNIEENWSFWKEEDLGYFDEEKQMILDDLYGVGVDPQGTVDEFIAYYNMDKMQIEGGFWVGSFFESHLDGGEVAYRMSIKDNTLKIEFNYDKSAGDNWRQMYEYVLNYKIEIPTNLTVYPV